MKPDKVRRFLQELKRRRVFRGIVVYGASTLVLFEAATNLANFFGQESPPTWFVVLLGVGFFVSLWFSWIYDITPGGIRKTEPDTEEKVAIPQKDVRTYKTTTFISIMIIVGLIGYNIIDSTKAKRIKALDKTIAVLPYDNITLNRSQALNYEFIGREITSCLVKIKDYRTKSWDDCSSYIRGNKSIHKIGQDLSVSLLVDWMPYENDQARHLFVELISADDGEILMSERFEIAGTWCDEVCRLSRKISKRIARETRTYLTPQERAFIDEQTIPPPASLAVSLGESYTQFAWKKNITQNSDPGEKGSELTDSMSFVAAINYFTEAIEEFPSFAEAYANRAKARLWGYKAGFFDRSVLDESREDIDRAFRIDENAPEAYVAYGFYYYYGLRQYQLASVQFEKACELKPNNNEYLFYLSKIYTTLGRWPEALILSNKVFESNPQNALFFTNLGFTYLYLNEYHKAILCQDRSISLMPYWYAPYINKALFQFWRGNLSKARNTLFQAEENTGKNFDRFRAELDLHEGKYESAVRNIELANEQEFKDLEESTGFAYLIKAKICKHAGMLDQAEENYRKAAEYYMLQVTNNPMNYYARSKLAIAFANLGEKQKAIESAEKAYEIGNEVNSAVIFPMILYDMSQTYALIDDYDSSINILQKLLETNSPYTSEFIKTDPDLKPLFNDSRPKIANL